MADVALDGAGAEVEVLGDLGVGQAAGDQGEHLPFPVGDAVQGAGQRGGRLMTGVAAIAEVRLKGGSRCGQGFSMADWRVRIG